MTPLLNKAGERALQASSSLSENFTPVMSTLFSQAKGTFNAASSALKSQYEQ